MSLSKINIKLLALSWLLVFSSCNHLLYPATREPFLSKKFLEPSPVDITVAIPNTAGQGYLHAWLFKASSQIKKGLVVHFHGNGENLTTHFNYFRWVNQLGFDYLIFDYRGYGQSSDDSASQQKTVEDGLAIFNYIQQYLKPTMVVAIGQSLGSNVLVRTLQDLPPAQQPNMVILDSSFTSYQSAARSVLTQRWFLYPLVPLAYLAIDDDYSAKSNYSKTPALPALFFHGSNDAVIKPENGLENYKSWPGVKVMIIDDGGTHTSSFADPRFINKNKEIFLNCFSMIEKKDLTNFSKCGDLTPPLKK